MVASLERWGKRDAMGQKLMTFVERMDAPAPNQFRLFLREACGFVLEALGKPSSNVPFVMPKRVADTPADKQIDDATGSGPYVFVKEEFKPGDKAVYLKNQKYVPRKEAPSGTAGGKRVYVERVEWNLALRDAQSQVNALVRGEIDILEQPAFESYASLKADKNIQVVNSNPLGFQYMGRFNHLHPPFNNPKVRQAALAAFAQEPFLRAQVGVKELYRSCASMFTCGTPYGSAKGSEVQSKSNLRKAQELLKASGYDGAAAAPGRLQGRPAGDGLEHAGRPPREEGPAAAGRLEHVLHRVGGARHLEPAHQPGGRRAGREVLVRLALRSGHREAARRVRSRHRRRQQEVARGADPGARLRDRDARAARRVRQSARRAPQRHRFRHRPRQPLLEHQEELIQFIARRLAATIPVLLIVAVLVFLLLRLTPGDPAAILAGDAATAEQIAAIRSSLGLDQPLIAQFAIWMGKLLSGDLGQSYYFRIDVATLIGQRLEPTFALAVLTILVAVIVSIPLGVLAAWRFGGWLDRALMGFSVLGFSVPVFVLAYLLIWLLSLKLGWLPVQGYVRISEGFFPFLKHLILPAITLSVIYIALIARVTRASVLEALGEDYIRTARAKGLPELRVVVRHALANAAVPIATVIGIGVAILIGGVVVTESVYAIPGLGRLTVDAVLARDFPTIQGVILFFSFVYVAVNLLIDLSYVFLDPRIRY